MTASHALPNPVGTVARMAVRLIRRGALFLALGVGVFMAVEAFAYLAAYPDEASRRAIAQFGDSPAVRMLQGAPHAVDTVGGYAVWDAGWVLQSIVAVWALLVTGRLLRAEEDEGRVEYVLAGPVGARRTTAVGLLAVAAGLGLAGAAIAVVLATAGAGVGGSLLFGLGVAAFGGCFGGLAAVAAQALRGRRRTTTVTLALFGLAYVLRMAGNSADSRAWLHWLTPFGWMERLHPYRDPDWLALAALLVTPLVLGAVAVWLRGLRDTGGALLEVPEKSTARTRLLGGTLAFAWRGSRGMLAGWSAGVAFYGLILGLLVETVADLLSEDPTYRELLATLGWDLTDATRVFVSEMGSIIGLIAALYACWRVAAARAEESAGLLDLVLVQPVTRARWLGDHLLLAVLEAVAVTFAGVLAVWGGARLSGGSVAFPDVLASLYAPFPAVLLFGALAALVFAVAPRLTTVVPAVLAIVAYVLAMTGPALNLPSFVLGLSPFHHLPAAPAEPYAPVAAAVLTLVAVALAGAALALFRRRDVTGALPCPGSPVFPQDFTGKFSVLRGLSESTCRSSLGEDDGGMAVRGAHWLGWVRDKSGKRVDTTGTVSGLVAILSEGGGETGPGLCYRGSRDDGGLLRVTPCDPYLAELRADGALEAREYWYTPWEGAFRWPVIEVEVVNGSAAEVRVREALFAVASSRTDPRPVPLIHGASYGADLTLDNLGWGPMEEGVLRFHLETPEGAVLGGERTCALDADGHPADLKPLHAAVCQLGPEAREGTIHVAGTLEYTQTEPDGSRTRHTHPYRGVIVFGAPPVGAPLPPAAPCQVLLRADGAGYTETVAAPRVVPPGGSARFTFTVGAPRSSLHNLSVALRTEDNRTVPCGDLSLELFCSRADARTLFCAH
ncbi:hypothetical protein LO762_06885 [Actinocorallia sp. API 0066]|uniref:ABC transporter permease n=1 Tax=Actinocorallia sp. API 0066 TaxID=2896846 RepID=UPI001E4AB1ED|nr:hypothetical protein [Actinocorallia sp. API 0066]MCD0448915.1 hypothetical protein [Actinocorallia sp. API 0066]